MAYPIKWGVDPRVVGGNQALTVQPFTELNSKLGTQYSGAFFIPSLAASATADLSFEVGAQPVLLKDIVTQFNSELISIQFFRGPTGVTGGTAVTIYNLNDGGAVAPTSVITAGVTVTTPGTAVGPREYSIGSTGIGNEAIATSATGTGVERVLEAGATYLFRLINEDSTNATAVSSLATWYQGPLSTDP